MSEAVKEEIDTMMSCCASCGIAEIDDVKLKDCDGCDLVKYCCDECQGDHKSEHEEDCKKRAAELRDELLFKQPEGSCYGDCPICCLPMPLDIKKSSMCHSCSKVICFGCEYANMIREDGMRLLNHSCPFCRNSTPRTKEEWDKQRMKRIEANDPIAMSQEGACRYNKGDCHGAFKYLSKAADMDADAHYKLSLMYREGLGVEKDEGKEMYHTEEAAIGGHPNARYNLGSFEWNNGDKERAVKHYIIAATQGEDDSTKMLMNAFKMGCVEKEELAAALRAHQAAVDATKSPQRDAAEEYHRFKMKQGLY